MQTVATRVLAWYASALRDLPWRAPGTDPWGVYVSEVMAQQTQVERVAAEWPKWMERWPTPAALAASSPADVVRQWGRLGYPRRALWMHAAATRMVEERGGEVPRDAAALRALPGVGEYTAAAIRAFAFGERTAVLDVNVRRVHARVFDGAAAPGPSITNAEREHHQRFLPDDASSAATLSQAVMEFGAVVCTARDPRCDACPLAGRCAWLRAGKPAIERAARRQPKFAGSDRACRGALMRVLREAHTSVSASALEAAWADALQRERCLDSLVADGLAIPLSRNRFSLPG
jgi:A/G-specific adenine glycosylase